MSALRRPWHNFPLQTGTLKLSWIATDDELLKYFRQLWNKRVTKITWGASPGSWVILYLFCLISSNSNELVLHLLSYQLQDQSLLVLFWSVLLQHKAMAMERKPRTTRRRTKAARSPSSRSRTLNPFSRPRASWQKPISAWCLQLHKLPRRSNQQILEARSVQIWQTKFWISKLLIKASKF